MGARVARSVLGAGYRVASEGMEMETKNGETFLVREVLARLHLYVILERLSVFGFESPSLGTLPGDAYRSSEGKRGPKGPEI